MKKLFAVGINYMTTSGRLGSESYEIEAMNHQEALAIARDKATKPGRSKFSGDAVEITQKTPPFEMIPLNLQQGMIRATSVPEGTLNQIVAIYSRHRQKLLILPAWRDDEDAIRAMCPMDDFILEYADSFHIDSWDGKLYK